MGTAIVVLAVAGSALLLLGGPDGAPIGAPTRAPTVDTTTQARPASPSPPTASPAPSPTASAITDLPGLVPERVRAFEQDRSHRAGHLEDDLGADDGRRVYYTNGDGRVVRHLVALFSGNGTAGKAFRQRRAEVLTRRGARVVEDTPLEDQEGARQGRLIEVRTRAGELITLWRNRNLVAVLGPAPPRLTRRLYEAWPY